MTTDTWLMIGILAIMFALLIWEKWPTWLVFMGTLTVAMTLGLAPTADLLSGFANIGVATVGILFVIAAGMYSTGAITLLTDRFIGLPKSLREAQTKILPPTAVGSAFLNNTPLVAMMIPVIRDISQSAGLAASKLLIPLSFASILGGASTLIGTSTNLIIAGLMLETFGQQLNIFFPTPVGLPAAIVGIGFVFLATRLLPDYRVKADEEAIRRLYRVELVVDAEGAMVAKTLEQAGFAQPEGFELASVKRQGAEVKADPSLALQAGDRLVFVSDIDSLPFLWTAIRLIPAIKPTPMETSRYTHRLVEVIVSKGSVAVGHRVSDLPLRDDPIEYMLVAVSRQGQAPDTPLSDLVIEAGDTAVLEVTDSFFYDNHLEENFLVVRRLRGYRIQRTSRAVAATVITLGMILLAAFGVMSMLNAALLGAGAMLITGCLTIDRAWRSVDWKTLVVLGAAIGLGAAVTESGLTQLIADGLTTLGSASPYVALVLVFLGSVIMTNVITNAAAAAFMFPVVVSLTSSLGVNPIPFVVILMLGTSYAFINPAGYQTNLMVQGPGGYKFMDFAKLGLPLTIIVGTVAVVLAPLIYGF